MGASGTCVGASGCGGEAAVGAGAKLDAAISITTGVTPIAAAIAVLHRTAHPAFPIPGDFGYDSKQIVR